MATFLCMFLMQALSLQLQRESSSLTTYWSESTLSGDFLDQVIRERFDGARDQRGRKAPFRSLRSAGSASACKYTYIYLQYNTWYRLYNYIYV